MSEVIKYKPVFGPQHLFESINAEVIVVGPRGDKTETNIGLMAGNTPDGYVIVSMRHIIKVPTWTKVDQLAGKLPEVGAKCRQGHKDEIVIAVTENFVVTECLDGAVCTTRKCEFMASYNPIETPAEKAARSREEWCNEAGLVCSLGMTTLTRIYDALLSGYLPVPVKGDE